MPKKIITLFIEELDQVRGGIAREGPPSSPSTLAAYEEGGQPPPLDPPRSSTLAAYEEGGRCPDPLWEPRSDSEM